MHCVIYYLHFQNVKILFKHFRHMLITNFIRSHVAQKHQHLIKSKFYDFRDQTNAFNFIYEV